MNEWDSWQLQDTQPLYFVPLEYAIYKHFSINRFTESTSIKNPNF